MFPQAGLLALDWVNAEFTTEGGAMAQTKQRAATKRAGGSQKTQARSRSTSKRTPTTKSKASKPTGKAPSANGSKPAASKAKVPLLAGGAALVGAAGGLVMGNRHGRHSGRLAKALPQKPQIKVDSRDVAKAAKEVGNFGAQVGHLASELKRARETANGNKHRSPVEVVLDGLTHRRSRS
jgi:hypothetical protein